MVEHRRLALLVFAAVGDAGEIGQRIDFFFDVEQKLAFPDQIDIAAQILWHDRPLRESLLLSCKAIGALNATTRGSPDQLPKRNFSRSQLVTQGSRRAPRC